MAETKTVVELKKELETVMEDLMKDDDDDCNLGVTDNAVQTLCGLKELKLKQNDQEYVKLKYLDFQEPPLEFRCPISGILMKDPVVVASGQTYDELSIRWLQAGNQRFPKPDDLLHDNVLIPNHSIKNLIANWCEANKIEIPRSSLSSNEDYEEKDNREHLVSLLERIRALSVSEQATAMKELRLLTTRLPTFRALFGETSGAITQLLNPFMIERSHSDASLYDDLVTIVLNISTHESNKRKIVEESPIAITFLIESLRTKSIKTRSHAAAALSALSTLDSNKRIIGNLGGIKPLIELIEEGHPLALKDAALAILNICKLCEYRERAVFEGAVIAVMDKIIDRIHIDEMLEILAMLCSHERAIEEMEENNMLSCLFLILRGDTSEQNKEHCIAIVHAVCFRDKTKMNKIYSVKKAYDTLSSLASTGTSRAQRKATAILERLNKADFI